MDKYKNLYLLILVPMIIMQLGIFVVNIFACFIEPIGKSESEQIFLTTLIKG